MITLALALAFILAGVAVGTATRMVVDARRERR